MTTAPLPGSAIRPATLDDAQEIADLTNESNVAEIGFPWTTPEEVRDELTAPGHDERDALVAVADDGSLAGYLTVWSDEEPVSVIHQIGFVRPELSGTGLSSLLLRVGEDEARRKLTGTPHLDPVHLRVSRWATNDAAARLFGVLGYRYVRTFHALRMSLAGFTATTAPPEGITIRAFDERSEVAAVHAALAEAFTDHRSTTSADPRRRRIGRPRSSRPCVDQPHDRSVPTGGVEGLLERDAVDVVEVHPPRRLEGISRHHVLSSHPSILAFRSHAHNTEGSPGHAQRCGILLAMERLYPPVEPFATGMLPVGEGHEIYWEMCGDPEGEPVIVLHGGPGSSCTSWHRRMFDPERTRIVLFDQRGCGRNTPHASEPNADLSTNTTARLLDDIERLRKHLEADRWIVWGGSWGCTLALPTRRSTLRTSPP